MGRYGRRVSRPTEAHTISVALAADPQEVYSYITDPRRLPTWAAGLAHAIEERDGQWVATNPSGEWIVEFVDANALGVADHRVTLPDGSSQLNPMRVVPNGDGAAVLFTVFRGEVAGDDEWRALIATITADLEALRGIFESAA